MVDTLLVEDNEYFRNSFKQILVNRFPDMKIFEAGNGDEALDHCSRNCPDLVLLDISLPEVNGLEVCKTIRKYHPETLIFILTNYDFPEYRQAARQNGADHFFSKDSRQEEILGLIESELRVKDRLGPSSASTLS